MPSIEILSVDCHSVPKLSKYKTLTLISEIGVPAGHRGSFDKYLKKYWGLFVHLGNPKLKPGIDKYWNAHELINLEAMFQQSETDNSPLKLVWRNSVVSDVLHLSQNLIKVSPKKTILFSTDYQLGGECRVCRDKPWQWPYFATQLRNQNLHVNTLYEITV